MARKQNLDHRATLDQALAAFRAHGLGASMRPADGGNAGVLELSRDSYAQAYLCEVRHTLSPPMAGALITQLRQQAALAAYPTLLVADYIAPRLGELLRAAGQEYVDTLGNAWLSRGPLLIFIAACRPARAGARVSALSLRDTSATGANPANAKAAQVAARYDVRLAQRPLAPAAIKLLFALMCRPELAQANYRDLAAAAGVALGALTQSLEDLQQHGYVSLVGRSRHLLASRRLLDDWALMYARTLRPKLLLCTLAAPDNAPWQDWSLTEDAALWGGEPAATLRIGFLRPGVLTLYAAKLPGRLMVNQRLKAPEPGQLDRLVEIRRIFWGAALHGGMPGKTVPAVLIYADLLASGDARCIETAQKLYEQELAGLFPAA